MNAPRKPTFGLLQTVIILCALVFLTPARVRAQSFTTTKIGTGVAGTLTPLTDGPGSYSIVGGGDDIGGSGDNFTFHHTTARLDFDWRVQVASLAPNDNDSKAGLMVRESVSGVSRMGFVRVTPFGRTLNGLTGDSDVGLQFRDLTQGTANACNLYAYTKSAFPSNFIRLEKHGDTLGAYRSQDGINWFLLCSQDTTKWAGGRFADSFQLGIAVSRGAQGSKELAESVFRGLTTKGPFPPTISLIQDQTLTQDQSSAAIPFTIADADTATTSLKVTTTSSNPTLFSSNGIQITPPAAAAIWSLKLVPTPGQFGDADISVTVSDGTATTTTSFKVRVNEAVQFDYGDAPDPTYPTTRKNNGASQRILAGFSLGDTIDGEVDGQPNATATGDGKDEDGVTFSNPIVVGRSVDLTVSVKVPAGVNAGKVDAWIDWNKDGDWLDQGEHVLDTLQGAGIKTYTLPVPSTAVIGTTFVRIRLSQDGKLESFGASTQAGEVEDYSIVIQAPELKLDFGDAPDPKYPTLLANNGARHVVNPDVKLGALIDSESDGQPNINAKGDDATPANGGDEDGVKFLSQPTAGQSVSVVVTASVLGRLSAWIDWGADGSWADTVDWVLANVPVVSGPNTFVINVPANAKPGITFARFRYSRGDVKEFVGLLPDGEVEDYELRVAPAVNLDFGDAPETYKTRLASDGPRHIAIQGFTLGKAVDSESDGQPSSGAGADGTDEDGVIFSGVLTAGTTETITVTTSTAGVLDAWMDFNIDGDFADAGERIFTTKTMPGGPVNLQIAIPAGAKAGQTYARFRFSKAGVKDYFGAGEEGEVEDYAIRLAAAKYDFGDAPEEIPGTVASIFTKYPTTLARDGARHTMKEGFTLGRLIDVESDGLASTLSNGDDLSPQQLDDEDGVIFPDPLVPGEIAVVRIHAPKGGFLDGWVDFEGNGDWSEPGNRVFNAQPLVAPITILSFAVPANSKLGATYSRFRLSETGGLDFKGYGGVGEVEDHLVEILPDRGRCDLACTGKDFWVAFPGNYYPDPTNQVRPQLCLVGQKGTVVTISIGALNYSQTFAMPANSAHIPLPTAADLGDLNDAVINKGVHVVATEAIGVYGMSQVKYTSDGFLGLPTESLAREYVVASYQNVHSGVPELNGTQFAVVATQPLTTLTITPSFVTPPHDSGFTYSLVLTNAGDVYQLRNTNDAPADLTGTIVESDKAVAVFSGHQVANVNSSDAFFADYIVEQLPPVRRWGREFFPVYSAGRLKGDTYRILASADNTDVQIDGTSVATLNRGEFYETVIDTVAAHIQTSKRTMVVQYANSSDFDGVTSSDPFMTLVPARPQFSPKHIFCTPPQGFDTHYINIVVPVSAKNTVKLDGVAIGVPFFDIGASGYAFGQKEITAGIHTVTTDLPSGVTVYGWSTYESYAYPACLFFGDTTPPEILNCPTQDIIAVASNPNGTVGGLTGCVASVPNLTPEIRFKDNCNINDNARVIQDPAAGTLVGVGTNIITLSVTDSAGNVGECRVRFIVKDPNPDGELSLQCPQDLTTKCTSTNGAIVRYVVKGLRGCTPVGVTCTPPSGSLFPPGVTTVVCKINDPDLPPLECSFQVTVNCVKLTPNISINFASPDVTQKVIKLQWDDSDASGIILESADEPSGPWAEVPGARSGFTVDAAAQLSPNKYFRLRER